MLWGWGWDVSKKLVPPRGHYVYSGREEASDLKESHRPTSCQASCRWLSDFIASLVLPSVRAAGGSIGPTRRGTHCRGRDRTKAGCRKPRATLQYPVMGPLSLPRGPARGAASLTALALILNAPGGGTPCFAQQLARAAAARRYATAAARPVALETSARKIQDRFFPRMPRSAMSGPGAQPPPIAPDGRALPSASIPASRAAVPISPDAIPFSFHPGRTVPGPGEPADDFRAGSPHGQARGMGSASVWLRSPSGRLLSRSNLPPAGGGAPSSRNWADYWDGERLRDPLEGVEPSVETGPSDARLRLARPDPKEPGGNLLSGALLAAGGTLLALPTPGLAASARAPAPQAAGAWIAGLAPWLPYLQGAGVLLGAWVIDRLARKLNSLFWKRIGFPRYEAASRFALDVLIWGSGLNLAVKSTGMDSSTLLSSLGIPSVAIAVTLAFQSMAHEDLGNLIRGAVFLLDPPFILGDRIRLNEKEYTVLDMGFRGLVLEPAPGKHTHVTYAQLASSPILVRRVYNKRGKPPPAPSPGLLARSVPGQPVPLGLVLRAFGPLASASGFAAAAAAVAHSAMARAFSYLLGGCVLLGTWWMSRAWLRAARYLARSRGWTPYRTAVFRLIGTIIIYAVGASASLLALGVGWPTLLTGLGIPVLFFSVAASYLLGNFSIKTWITLRKPFLPGDTIGISRHRGTVQDITLHHVILRADGDESSHILLPLSLFKTNPFDVDKQYVQTSLLDR